MSNKIIVEKNDNLAADATNFVTKATLECSIDMFKLLINLGADVTYNNNEAIILLAGHKNSMEKVNILIENGADITDQNGSALVFASLKNNFEMVKFCIEKGIDPNVKDGEALICAADNGNIEIVKYLLEHGANPKLQDNKAIKETGVPEIVKLLLDSGVDSQAAAETIFAWNYYNSEYYHIAKIFIEKTREKKRLNEIK